MKNPVIEGFWISFDNAELADIKNKLRVLGYSDDGEGLKKYILKCMKRDVDGEEPAVGEGIVKQVLEFAMNNPETVDYYKNIGQAVLQNVARKLKR